MKAPDLSCFVLTALFAVLCGKEQPVGHLTMSLFGDPDRLLTDRLRALDRFGLKTGPMTGIRAYPDTAFPTDKRALLSDATHYTDGFCFGHGLTYTKFRYTRLTFDGEQVTFHVTNTGVMHGTAVPQLYIGTHDGLPLLLCGFTTVPLQPGESRTVTLKPEKPTQGKEADRLLFSDTESYTILVGESAADIRLKRILLKKEQRAFIPAPDHKGEPRSHYCMSESNILDDGYMLEANYTMKKRNPKNLVLGFILLALAAAVRFFFADLGVNSVAVSIVSLILLLCATASFIFEIIDRSRYEKQIVREVNELNERFYTEAGVTDVKDVSEIFIREFDTPQVSDKPDRDTETKKDDEYAYINRAGTLSDTVNDLIRSAGVQGYSLSEGQARTLLSVMSCTRLLIPCGLNEGEGAALQELLCSFFGTIPASSAALPLTADEAGLLLTETQDGKSYSALYTAVEEARSKPQSIFLYRLTGIDDAVGCDTAAIYAALMPFVRFAASPETANTIRFTGIDGELHTLRIPRNFWLMLDPGHAMPDFACRVSPLIAETAAFFTVPLKKCEPVSSGQLNELSFFQFRYLWENARSALDISEDMWKKTDLLADYAARHGVFAVNNRIAVGMEQLAATYRAAGGDQDAALDQAVAVRLIPGVLRAVAGNISTEDMTPEAAAEQIFGEEAFPITVKAAHIHGSKNKTSVPAGDGEA